jgi:UDP-N-acetylmuramyl pentapeptide synthase
VGPEFKKYNDSNFSVFKNVEELIDSGVLGQIQNFKVLIKGSRSIQLEKLECHL